MHRSDGKTSSTRIRRRTCHSQITTYDEFDRKNAFVRVFFSLIKPGEDLVWISRSWKDLFQLTIERGNLWKRQDQVIQQEDYGRSWSSQDWKSGAAEHDRSGKPEENSWDSLQKVDPHREEPLLGRNAHSARHGESIHDRTGQPVSENLQEQAHFENFVMGSDATEFVNQVRDQVRNRQKRMSSIAENCTEHSIIWGIFMATTLNAATIVGKNFSNYSKCCQES